MGDMKLKKDDVIFSALKLIEDNAVDIDGEWGSVRTIEELLNANAMPCEYMFLRSYYEDDENEKWMDIPLSTVKEKSNGKINKS